MNAYTLAIKLKKGGVVGGTRFCKKSLDLLEALVVIVREPLGQRTRLVLFEHYEAEDTTERSVLPEHFASPASEQRPPSQTPPVARASSGPPPRFGASRAPTASPRSPHFAVGIAILTFLIQRSPPKNKQRCARPRVHGRARSSRRPRPAPSFGNRYRWRDEK